MNQDLEHLRLLSIFHYVVGALAALFACFPIIHLVIGLLLLFNPSMKEGEMHGDMHGDMERARFVGAFFVAFAGFFILAGWTVAVCVCIAGRNLVRHRRYTFCLVMAAILCVFIPFGTVLGVFTIIVLVRPSVKELFEQEKNSMGLESRVAQESRVGQA